MTARQQRYNEIDAINFSTLKLMNQSPLHYRHNLTIERDPTPAMVMGLAVHTSVLEPDKFPLEYAIYSGGIRRGKEWDAFQASNSDKTILKPDEYDTCLAIRNAVRGHDRAGELLKSGISEVMIKWTDDETGLACKGRFDWLTVDNILVDLKSGRAVDPGGFGNQSARMLYHAQIAFYYDGLRACKRKISAVKFICVEQAAPHDVMVYDVPDKLLQQGREKYRGWLIRLQECRLADKWPGRCEYEMPLTLPEWASSEDDIAGMDLDF